MNEIKNVAKQVCLFCSKSKCYQCCSWSQLIRSQVYIAKSFIFTFIYLFVPYNKCLSYQLNEHQHTEMLVQYTMHQKWKYVYTFLQFW